MAVTLVTWAVAFALAAAPPGTTDDAVGPAADDGEIPGGYWDRTEVEREPPDGHERVVIGSILVSLGTLGLVTGGIAAYMTAPAHCQDRLAKYELSDDQCRSLFTYNIVQATMGGLMLTSGAVVLGLGLRQRKRHREWRRRRGLVLAPMFSRPGGWGISLSSRF